MHYNTRASDDVYLSLAREAELDIRGLLLEEVSHSQRKGAWLQVPTVLTESRNQ